MKNLRGPALVTIGIIAVVLGIAWLSNGGKAFKSVALICYGFSIGWLNGFVVARYVYKK